MDKFGIFNLLNSFFSLNGEKKDDKNQSSPSDLVGNIISALSNKSPAKKEENAVKPTLSSRPLQENMISTICSHDALVKRVQSAQLKNQ